MGNTSVVDAGCRQMAELIFLEYGIKCLKVWKVRLILNGDGDKRKKYKVICTAGSMYIMHVDEN